MEYPMLITCASFYGIPSGVRTVESLVIHEFVHQYFMAVIATNEKEDAWMDEGFVTYFEDRILDHYYGDQESLISLGPLHSGNAENSRLEYTSYEGRSAQPIALPGWERTGAFKPIVYSKTATVLKTMEGIIGRSNMDEVIKTYYQRWAFKHPKEHDFIALVKEMVEQLNLNFQVDEFFNQCLHGTEEIDYYVEDLGNGNFKIDNYGHLTIPTIIEVTYPNGSQEVISWDGDRPMTWSTKQPIKSITVDPEQAIYLDVNLLNNTWTSKSNPWTSASYASKFGLFLQKTVKWMGVLW
jgi:hypothetical protein